MEKKGGTEANSPFHRINILYISNSFVMLSSFIEYLGISDEFPTL